MKKETKKPVNKKGEMVAVDVEIEKGVNEVWGYWNTPEHIMGWAFASSDWYVPAANNDLRVGGHFSTIMSSRDGKNKFDFNGTYKKVVEHKLIEYEIEDGRKVKVEFKAIGNKTLVIETFEAESENPVNMQRQGWQAILNNFKKYVEDKV
jgi:uncharacterized protein YndB with AHSA1/START domain